MRWILLLFALFGPLLGRLDAAETGALPIVLASRVDLQLAHGGIKARVWLSTHAAQVPSRPFPVVSGAGSLLQWKASEAGGYQMVDPTETAPGSPAFVQRVSGRAELTLELWQPLTEDERELVLRLPPTPEGVWSLVGLKEGTVVDAGDAGRHEVGAAGAISGETPDGGLLWLSWAGRERARTAGFLEASRVDLYVRQDAVHYRARLQGFQPSGQLAVHWSPAFVPKPPEGPATGAARTPREDGVDVLGLGREWFDETFEGTVRFDERGEASVELPRVTGLARARMGQVTIHPEVPRALRRIGPEDPGGKPAWIEVALPEGRRRYQLASRAQAVPLRFHVSGDVAASDDGLKLTRMSARSLPVEGPQEAAAPELLRTRVEYKLEGAAKNFSLHFPEAVRVDQARWGNSLVKNMPKEVQAGTTADFPIEGEGKFVVEFYHGAPGAAPAYGALGLRLPQPGRNLLEAADAAPPTATGDQPLKRDPLVPAHFEWSGRLPAGLEVLSPTEVGGFPGERRPYPLRWTEQFFEGVLVVLREAGVVVAFGVALLLGLYASLFMRPPNKQAVYMLAFSIAVFGLIYNLFQAAGTAAAAPPPPAGGGSMLPEMVERMRDSARRLTDFMQPGTPAAPGAGVGADAHDHGAEPATPGFGGLLSRRLWSEGDPGAGSGGVLRPRVPVDAQGRPMAPDVVFGLDLPPPIPDDWSVTRIPTEAAVPPTDLQLTVGKSGLLQAVGLLLGVVVLAGAVLSRQGGTGPAPIIAMAAGSVLLIPLDLAFPRSAAPGASLVLASLLGVVLHRAITDGMALWERVRAELEQRRLKALSRPGSATGGGRDTGGGAFSGSALQKNEATYEDVFPDDEGITFIMGEG